ncbi:araC family transcriptional regulator [Streptomyces laurentii]|uniref:AraC family transcriptional regulator n=1 Tax=Streptomyces laurentii TaxID=39478 RepID=A0A160P748_STRLU|nr:araC family transcriptional regulator [Streptomyces laurentii]
MDRADRYEALARGALFVAESAEDAYRLGALDRFLKPWIRDRLHSLGGLLDSCDTPRQLAEDTRAFARTVATYSELRNQRNHAGARRDLRP